MLYVLYLLTVTFLTSPSQMSYPDLLDLTPQPLLILLWLLLFTSILNCLFFGSWSPGKSRVTAEAPYSKVLWDKLLLAKGEVSSLPSLQHYTVPSLSVPPSFRKGNVAQKQMLLSQFTDLNTETKEVLHGVNTPWNISSFWSCLSHLCSHLSAQVPLSLCCLNWIVPS